MALLEVASVGRGLKLKANAVRAAIAAGAAILVRITWCPSVYSAHGLWGDPLERFRSVDLNMMKGSLTCKSHERVEKTTQCSRFRDQNDVRVLMGEGGNGLGDICQCRIKIFACAHAVDDLLKPLNANLCF